MKTIKKKLGGLPMVEVIRAIRAGVKCLLNKHTLADGLIQGERFRYCERCKYTQYLFLFGWGKIERTEAIQNYIDNNANAQMK